MTTCVCAGRSGFLPYFRERKEKGKEGPLETRCVSSDGESTSTGLEPQKVTHGRRATGSTVAVIGP